MAFQIAVAQFQPKRKNVFKNIKIIQSLLQGLQADLIVLPELANSGYLYETPEDLLPFSESQDAQGGFLAAISELAGNIDGVIVAGYAEKAGNKIYNSAAAVSGDGVLENYRKIHLYSYEKSLFETGDVGFKVFTWKGVQIGMMICFDWIFPESARTLALNGAQVIAHPANLVLPYCQDAMITRSIENKVFTVTANRTGKERIKGNQLLFTGLSQITDPKGNVLFRGPKSKATVHILLIDPEEALDKKISDNNDLFVDRKSQFYYD